MLFSSRVRFTVWFRSVWLVSGRVFILLSSVVIATEVSRTKSVSCMCYVHWSLRQCIGIKLRAVFFCFISALCRAQTLEYLFIGLWRGATVARFCWRKVGNNVWKVAQTLNVLR